MSKMYVILVIFLLNRIINAENSSEEKYIDLLPEKEKEEFLEKIARRIFNGVQSKDDRDGVSGEVSESELNEHSEFVNHILRDESENLRKNGVENGSNGDLNQKDEIGKETLDKKDIVATDDTQLVDLTLRDNKRDKRNSFTNTDKESKIVRLNISNIEGQDKAVKDKRESSDKEDIQIKHFRRSKVKNKIKKVEITTETTNHFDSGKEKYDSNETIIASHGNLADKEEKTLETKGASNIGNIEDIIVEHSTHKAVISQSNLEESLIDVKSNEKREIKSDDNIDDVNNKNTDRLRDYININTKTLENNASEEISNEKSPVPLASESTTFNEPTPEVKFTTVQTEKLTIGNDITKASENIDSKAHSIRSDTVKTYVNDSESEDVKNIAVEKSGSDDNIDIVSVAVETMHDLAKTNSSESKKEYQTDVEDTKKTHSDSNRSNSTSSFNQDTSDTHTTEKSKDITTFKTEVLTKAAMRMNIELSDSDNFEKHTAINDKENITSGILTNDAINGKIIKSNERKDVENGGIDKNGIKKENSVDKRDINSYSFVNDIIKVIREKLKPDWYSYSNDLKTIPLYNDIRPEKYKVYEVPTNIKPFKKHREDKNKENPYYAPIYNYSPDNAYYNPYNKLGPNADDNKGDVVARSVEEKFNENESNSINERYDDESDDKYDVNKISLEERDDSVNDELKQYGINKRETDPNLDKLIKGYTKYKNQRKFKFGNKNHNQMKNTPYKLKLPVVVQHSKFNDIILNPNDYLDMDYSYDRNQESPNIGRCELPKVKPVRDNEDTKNLKSRVREIRELLYKQKIFGYVPPIDKPDENEDDKSDERRDVLRAQNEKSTDKGIAMDYFFGRSNDETDNRFEIVDKGRGVSNKIKEYKESFEDNDVIKPVTPFTALKELRSNEGKFKTIRDVLSISDAKDHVPTVDKLMSMKLSARSNDEMQPYVTVLEDMVRNNAKSLRQYDWLGTTVDIQSALLKLMDMTDKVQYNIPLSYPDLQLLKYSIYLHKATKKAKKQSRKSKMLPRNRKKRKGFIKESGLLNRHWLFRMMAKKYDTILTSEDFDDFNDFLNELQYYLYDLHTAVQEIANVTKYNNQNWFENLKELYIDTKRKHILEVLLHVTTTRLLDLIENSTKDGVEEDFLTFVINNERDVKKTKIEMMFAQKIVDELKIK